MTQSDDGYRDVDGNECSLDELCRREPAWAANRLCVAEKRNRQLEAALRDLLNVIEADELIPESVSYMRKAREILATAPPDSEPAEPEAVRRLPAQWRKQYGFKNLPSFLPAAHYNRGRVDAADELDRALAQSEQGRVPDVMRLQPDLERLSDGEISAGKMRDIIREWLTTEGSSNE